MRRAAPPAAAATAAAAQPPPPPHARAAARAATRPQHHYATHTHSAAARLPRRPRTTTTARATAAAAAATAEPSPPPASSSAAAGAAPAFVRLRDVCYAPAGAGVPLLRHVSLALPSTGLALLVGRSGSGKTTLLTLLAGLSEPTAGAACVGAQDAAAGAHTPAAKRLQRVRFAHHEGFRCTHAFLTRRAAFLIFLGASLPLQVGLVFQFPERHFLAATVMEELTFEWPRSPAAAPQRCVNECVNACCARLDASLLPRSRTHASSPRTRSAKLAAGLQAALAAAGLSALPLRAPLRSLSGGTQRRLALALQLARAPPLLLLDEPLAGLDAGARAQLLPLLAAASKQALVLIVTHDTAELARCADAGAWRMGAGGVLEEAFDLAAPQEGKRCAREAAA
jgi:energy-coupling factor transporter ATP-binding protein EcfA2